jgi:hypothetical protein
MLGHTGFGQALGNWEMNAARSSFPQGSRPEKLTLRIETHPRGEVFTIDTLQPDGRATSSSTILYLDALPPIAGLPMFRNAIIAEGG